MGTLEFDHFPQEGPAERPYLPPNDLAQAQHETPRVRIRLADGTPAWLIIGHALAKKFLTDPRVSADMTRPGFPALGTIGLDSSVFKKAMIRRDGLDHRRLRRVLSGHFTPVEVDKHQPMVIEVIKTAVERLARHGPPADLVTDYARPIPTEVLCSLLALTAGMRSRLLVATPVVFDPATTVEEKRAAFVELETLVRELLDTTIALGGGTSPLVDSLLDGVSAGQLDREELEAMLTHLVIAGHHTTGSSLGLTLRQTLESPELRAAIMKSDESAGLAVEEMLRYNSVTRGAPRRLVLERVEIDGLVFEQGDGVIVALHSANHDPSIFANPDSLDPDRENVRQHITFGFGPHQCLGQALARRTVVLATRILLEALPGLRLAEPGRGPALVRDNSTVSLSELKVTW